MAIAPGPAVLDVPDSLDAPYDVDPELLPRTQRFIGVALLVLFALTVLPPLLMVGGHRWDDAKEYLQIVVPVEVGLLGSVIGFYFGSRGGDG